MDDTRVARIETLLHKLQDVFEATSYTLENMSAEIDGLRRELTSIRRAFRKGTRPVSAGRQLRRLRKSE